MFWASQTPLASTESRFQGDSGVLGTSDLKSGGFSSVRPLATS